MPNIYINEVPEILFAEINKLFKANSSQSFDEIDIAKIYESFYEFSNEQNLKNLKNLLSRIAKFVYLARDATSKHFITEKVVIQITITISRLHENFTIENLKVLTGLFFDFIQSSNDFDSRLLSLEETAQRLGISPNTLRLKADRKEIPTVACSLKGKRFLWSQVLKWTIEN